MDNRAKNFLAVDLDDLKRRRAQVFVELRKQNRMEQVSKRRLLIAQLPTNSSPSASHHFHPILLSHSPNLSTSSDVEKVALLATIIKAPSDPLLLINAIDALLRILTTGDEEVMVKTVQCGLAAPLVDLLSDSDSNLAYNSLWILTNLSAGAHDLVKTLMEAGLLLALPALLESESVEMVDQAIWALCNIAGDCVKYRDSIVKLGYHERVRRLLEVQNSEHLISSAVWLFANICRSLPLPAKEVVQMGLEVAVRCFELCDKTLALSDACNICEKATFHGDADMIDLVFRLNILPHLVKLTGSSDRRIATEALKAYANLLLGTGQQTDRVLDGGALELFERMLATQAEDVRKEVMWALSNVAAGEVQQARRLVQHSIFAKVLEELACPKLTIKREACITISNLCGKHDIPITHCLLASNPLPLLLEALDIPDPHLQLVLIEGLGCFLRVCFAYQELDEGTKRFEALEGLSKLQTLATTENSQVYRAVESLLSELYGHTIAHTEPIEEISPVPAFSFS